MAWLLAHIWAALAGVAVFGLLLGWSIRGMLLVGKMRRATVERDITLTELEQAKDEIERLYAAQRGKPIGGGDINIREELAEREVKISRLANELERAKKQLEDLKDRPEPPKAAASFAPRSLSEAVASDPAPALVWRNRHLESRVRHLENLIEQGVAVAAPAAQETAPQTAVATGAEADPTEVGLAAEAAPETGADTAKEEWQVGFLRQRVEALEDQLIKTESEAKQALEAADAAQAAQPAEAPAPAAPSHTPREGEVEEELARLRWRNRFLEGRLAYFEGDAREALEETAAAVVAEEEPADTLPAEAIPEERPNFGFQADEPVAEEEPPVAIAPAFGALEEVTPAEDETHAEDEVQAEEDLPAEEAEAEEIEPEAAEPEVADLEEADLEDNMPAEAEPEDIGASDEEPVTVADVFEETVGADTEEEVSGEGEAAVEDETSDAAEETGDEAEDDTPPVASSEEASRAILAALELDDEDETDEDAAEDDDTESDDELDADAEGEETDAEDDQDDEEAYDEDSDDDEDYDDSEDDEDFDEDDESDEDEDESDDDEDYDSDDEDEDFDEDEDDESDYDDEDADEEDGDDSLDDEDDESDEEEGEDLYAEDDTDEAGEAPDEDVYAETEEESDAEEDEAEDDGPVGTAPSALDKPVAGHADDLTVIGGIGPKIQELLNGMGIWHYEQIAAWTPDNIAWVDRELNFSGRIVREGWVEQAAILAGDMAEEDA